MPSTFSTIGVPVVDSEAAYEKWGERTLREGRVIPVHGGEYRVLRSDAGSELWAGVDRRGRLAGLVPHFAGPSRSRARLDERIQRAGESPFEGAFDGWALPGGAASPATPGDDVTPLVFDVPDALVHLDLRLPAVADVQIAAFAYESEWHPDPAAFRAAQAGEDVPFAEEAFAHLDVFDEGAERSAMAVLSGRVLDTRVRVNELTGLGFRWAAVRTLVGDIDLVADPLVVTGEPAVSGIVIGTFWLSGRIAAVHP